jgi:CheY-like chemotaxis protein
MADGARTILLIDDDDDVREVAQLALEMTAGWTVRAASSGAEGVRSAVAEPPDAILLDVMMPGMDGPATLAGLRADPATAAIPVILLTAKAQPADRRVLEGLDARGVLSKPFDPMQLAGDVAGLLGWGEV